MWTIFSPFGLCVSLLLVSVMTSFSFMWKMSSVWASAVILITFSSGLMILFSYSSSLVNFMSTIKSKILFVFLFTFMFFFFKLSAEMESKPEFFFKEFSSSLPIILLVLILVIFMIPMIDNCYSMTLPLQSSF